MEDSKFIRNTNKSLQIYQVTSSIIKLGLNMFLSLKFERKLGLVLIKTFDQFSPSSSKMREFSSFNQILLSLSDISSAFHDSI